MADTSGNLASRAASGAAWLATQTVLSRLTSLATQLILARLLAPEHFGQIGLVYTITSFATQLINPGVDDVLLQKQKHLRRWISPAFWLTLTCGIGGALLMVLLGLAVTTLARHYGNTAYGDPRVFRMILILACGAPLNAAALVPVVVLRSELRFAKVAALNFGEVIAQQVLLVLFAAWGMGAYSFVLPMPIVAAVRCLLLWVKARPPVHAHLMMHRWPSLIGSTWWVFGFRALSTLTGNGDYMILGALYADKDLVGQYFFAFVLATQILRVLSENIGAVLTPALNVIRDQQARMEQAVERASRLLASVMIPITLLQIVLAGPGMRLLFGHKWEPAIPLVQLLSAASLLLAPVWPMGSMMQAAGRFRANFLMWIALTMCFFALVFTGTWFWRTAGTAAAVSLWSWLAALVSATVAYRSMRGAMILLEAVFKPLLAGAAGCVPAVLIVTVMPQERAFEALAILLVTPIMLGVYAAVLSQLDGATFQLLRQYAVGAIGPVARILRRPAAEASVSLTSSPGKG